MSDLGPEYIFDLTMWKKVFPSLKSLRGLGPGFGIGDPRGLVALERWRERAREVADLGPFVQTDGFCFAFGEPTRRDVTKIGGIPYWPADKPWPMQSSGEPFTFLAQYRFCESVDIVGRLPGDLLLVFIKGESFPFLAGQDFLHFEWLSLGVEDLLPRAQVPEPAWRFVNAFGLRHRTVDYLNDIPVSVVKQSVPRWAIDRHILEIQAKELSRIGGMKIGGAPVYEIGERYGGDNDLTHRIPNARLLCSLSSVAPAFDVPYPWANREEPLTLLETISWAYVLRFADGFTLNIWIEPDDFLFWTIQYA